jgi:hypothetical protein
LIEEASDQQARARRLGVPADHVDGELGQTLNPGESMLAEVNMSTITARWAPNVFLRLKAWVEDGTGRRRESWMSVSVKTPKAPTATRS